MNGDVQITVTGTPSGDLPPLLLTHIDMLAGTLYGLAGWRVTVEIDPGIVLTATPARDGAPPQRPSEAPLSDEDGEDG